MTLKDKTISGLSWSFFENIARNGTTFIIGIILARLLSPREFGLIGMTTFFFAIFEPFIISGLPYALVRKIDCTQEDYSTVFYYNLFVSLVAYSIIFFTAGLLSNFFNEPQLKMILRILGLGLIINSFSIVQNVILTKRIDFKLLTKISVLSFFAAGIIGIVMAYNGYGVWSLVFKHIASYFFMALLLWIFNKWRPSFVFSFKSFRDLFSFGWKLLASGLLNQFYRNIFKLIIGKYFSATDLGFYTRAEQFSKLLSENVTRIIERVSYPVLSTVQSEKEKLKEIYRKLIRSTMFIIVIPMFGLAAVAEPLILTLIGEKWLPSVFYLQLLCFVGLFYPLFSINANMLNIQGRSDLVLKINLVVKIMIVPVIFIGIFAGIKLMIIGLVVHSVITSIIFSYWSGKFIDYTPLDLLRDILPSFLLASAVGLIVYLTGYILSTTPFYTLIIQFIVFALLTIFLTEIFKMKDYLYIKTIFFEKILHRFTRI